MTQITSEVLLVAALLTKGRFAVPWHQRYYDWTEEQVGELLFDLTEAIDEDRTSYFLGSIMLVDSEGVWQINDGQQRLITLSLVIAALCRRFAARRRSDSPREQRALRLLFDRSEDGDDGRRKIRSSNLLGKPVAQECLVAAYIALTEGATKMPWKDACERLNALPWAITPENVGDVWQGALWSGGTDGKIITKNRAISARLVAYMAGEELSEGQEEQLLETYRALFPETVRSDKVLPPRVVVDD